MISSYLKDNTRFADEVENWEEAIALASQPLIEKNYISPLYIEEMIENVKVNGSYIVIVPGLAMPHASSEKGVLETGIAYLNLKKPVMFPENQEVKVLLVLAAKDSTTHLDILSDVSSILIEDEFSDKLKEATSEEEIMELVETVEIYEG